jgi:uncharacterized protein involved in exopolysaccharide biosynthesis
MTATHPPGSTAMTRAPEPDPPAETSLRDVLAILARRRRLVLGVPLALAALTLAVTLVLPRTYTSTLVFMPERPSAGRLSGLAGVASQLGIQIPMMDAGLSPLFYAELLRSRQFLRELAASPFSIPGDSARPLLEFLRVRGQTEALRQDKAAERLLRLMEVVPDEAVGLVRVRVRLRSAELAQGVGERVVGLLNEFNGERRRTRAKAEREFAEGRQAEALRELRESEAQLVSFMIQNRDMSGSPAKVAQRDRMQREVGVRQQLYQSLRQSYEQARLEEVRDTPTITVVEEPQLPARPDSRKLIQKLALALLVGLLLGTTGALWQEHRASR